MRLNRNLGVILREADEILVDNSVSHISRSVSLGLAGIK